MRARRAYGRYARSARSARDLYGLSARLFLEEAPRARNMLLTLIWLRRHIYGHGALLLPCCHAVAALRERYIHDIMSAKKAAIHVAWRCSRVMT